MLKENRNFTVCDDELMARFLDGLGDAKQWQDDDPLARLPMQQHGY
jgi:uncharacterized protein YehS (DUF1456 family)